MGMAEEFKSARLLERKLKSMPSNKTSLREEELKKWLESNPAINFEDSDKIDKVVFLTGTIKSDPRASVLGVAFDHKYEIQPKAVFSVIEKSGKTEVGIIEISTSAIGLKDVGILHTYAKMINPKYALLLCEKSFSKELTYLLTDPKIGPRLMEYSAGRELQLLDFS
jgi:hypothetical protein